MIQRIFLFALSVFALSACLDDTISSSEQLEMDVQEIKNYLSANNLTAQESETGLHYIVEKEGTGEAPTLDLEVSVNYKGYLLDGTVFDESPENEPVTFTLQNTILGWQEGIQYFKKGGSGKLFIPSYMGYGASSIGLIPANAVLAFDIELLDVLTEERRSALESEKINAYLAENNLTADSTETGLYYIIEEEGEGGNPDANATVEVRYRGTLLDGTVFDQTANDATRQFRLNEVILGWQEGIPLFQKGGKGTLIIPSRLAYGAEIRGNIPAYSILVFEVELVDF